MEHLANDATGLMEIKNDFEIVKNICEQAIQELNTLVG
jgi:hypothetical protein